MKKPFGLNIAVKYAIEAMKEGKSPTSVILSNLFSLQKADVFPSHLDTHFFSNQKYILSDLDKKTLVKTLDLLKQPMLDKQEFLEQVFLNGWVQKKQQKVLPVKTVPKKQTVKKQTSPKPATSPTVFIKKSKIG